MKQHYFAALTVGVLAIVVESAVATVIDFDDLTGSGTVPTNYQGLTWTGWGHYDRAQAPYYSSSPSTRIYHSHGNNPLIEFGQTVTFEGLWIAGFSTGQYVIGYQAGNPVFTSSPQANDLSTFGTFLNLNWDVDAISVYSEWYAGSYAYYVLDDIKYTARGANVPDSGMTLSMLGGALGLLGLVSRRLQK
jgi:hypothetical protein